MDQSIKILIIDDNRDDRKKLIHSLNTIQNAAYSFVEAKNSTTALEYINEQIDCVLLSYSPPDMAKLELLEKIRLRQPFLPVILMTQEGHQDIGAAAVKKYTDDYLSNSSMNPEMLNQVIAKVLTQSSLEQKKKLMIALSDSAENTRRLLFATESTGIGIWELNLESKSAYRSLSHDTIFGYTQLLPKWDYQMFLKHVIPEDRTEVDNLFQHAMKTKSNWSFECRIQRVDGKKRWIWATGRHHFDSTGLTPMMSGVVMDTTERQDAEQHLKDDLLREKQILETLQESVEQFKLLANSVPQLVWMANETGWVYWYNDRWYEFTGTNLKESEGWGWQSLHDPKKLPSVMEKWRKCLATGEAFEMVYPLKGADGIFRTFLTRCIPVKKADGKITRWLGTNTDITAQKTAENNALEALRVSEERYDLTVRSMNIGVWDWNIISNELYWSKKLLDIMGITDQEFKPHYDEFSSRLHPKDREATEKMLFDHLKQLCPFNTEYRLRRNDGEYVWIHALGQAQWNTNDEPTRMAGSVNDISERKEAEKKMALLAAIVESSEDAIISKTLDSIIVSWNKGAEALFGYAAADIIGKHINLIIPPDRQHEELIILNEMKQGKPIRHMETIRMHKDGRYIDVALTISPVSDHAGRVIGVSKIVHDMSEHKKAARERESLIEKLTESNTELERFAYIASHDMQEPLRMVKNFSQLIAEEYTDKLNDEGKEYIDLVTTGAERMQAMINDLLEYARIGKNNTQRVSVNAAEEIKHVIENLSPLIKECKADVTYDDLPTLKGNPVQFMRLLQNLIGNGLKYQKQDNIPKIHISVQDKGDNWCFSVQDNGIGIEEEFITQVFEPFKRLHSWDEYSGTGIGLAVCRKIVENHNGKIWVTSSPGEGSIFYFTLEK